MHATWNFLAKRIGGGMSSIWLFSTLASVIYLPLVIVIMVVQQPIFAPDALLAFVGSVLLHIAYYFLLQRGYSTGGLSLVYPLARGSGPALSVIGAIVLLGETPSGAQLVGALLVSIGVLILTGNPLTLFRRDNRAAIAYALLCGLSIAAYTLWDKIAVSSIMLSPILLTWGGNVAQMILLAPAAVKSWSTVKASWREHRGAVLSISILDSLSYILFLIALTFSAVSVLAPLRQTSILMGALLGISFLGEEVSRRRFGGIGIMLAGVMALALG
ncbi:MAG: EamA family transporter [Anaerolineae bacterium]|nr:EamA family transporter [Chloroflexota bacterium]MBN8634855.1 EamA family transporter [Anaerolineae bacterium]